jgi:LmbE family N-acetylglucosaminyl deacetylase
LLPQLDVGSLGKRVLIVAPHPDDEGLATAGLIRREIGRKADVRVVLITAGDGSRKACEDQYGRGQVGPADFRRLGELRCAESRTAMSRLGLPPTKLIFLGYSDGSLNSLWDVNWDYDRLRLAANGATGSPYQFAYQKRAPYCGQNLVKNLESVIRGFRPSAIVYPDFEDIHHDHWAANAFVQYAITDIGWRSKEDTYLVHRHDFPYPRVYNPTLGLYPPPALVGGDVTWESLGLSESDERAKTWSLGAYAIPRLVAGTFIESFARNNELFAVDPIKRAAHIGDKTPAFGGLAMHYALMSDPAYDSAPAAGPAGDLRRVGMCIGDRKVFLALEARGVVSRGVRYGFRMRIFGRRRVDRLDICVLNDRVETVRIARNSVVIASPIPLTMRGRRLWIDVPAALFAGKTTCMLSVDTAAGGKQADKTAWQRISLH